jgi:hypothetical protein
MGFDNYTYIGTYIKVFLPEEEYTLNKYTCTSETCRDHGRDLSNVRFCSSCGSPTGRCDVKIKQPLNMYSFLEDRFGNGDLFSVVHKDDICSHDKEAFCFIIPNNKKQGGLHLNEDNPGEFPFPDLSLGQFRSGDWALLCAKLEEHQIKHTTMVGCILYAR